MKITEIIKKRKSIRSFDGKGLSAAEVAALKEYLESISQPLGGKARIEIVNTNMGSEPVRLGTYGVISGATDFMVLVYEEGPLAAANAGYLFEQAVLQCTEMGLGTCWLGGTLQKSVFAEQAKVRPGELMRIVSPVGHPAEKPKFRDRLMRAGAGSNKRKPFEQIFFEERFDKPLSQQNKYGIPLEMVRLSPSASNTQPWRALLEGENVHFYFERKSYLTDIDMGIALCHFELTCRESGIKGSYSIRESVPDTSSMNYLISWIAGNSEAVTKP